MGRSPGTVLKEAEARGEHDTGRRYYDHWLTALERLVVEKNMTDWGELAHEGETIREDDHGFFCARSRSTRIT